MFSEVLARSREVLTTGANVLVTVDLRLEGETLRITAQRRRAARRGGGGRGAGMRIWLEQTEAVPHIRALLGREGRGRGAWCWCRGSTTARAWRSRCRAGSR